MESVERSWVEEVVAGTGAQDGVEDYGNIGGILADSLFYEGCDDFDDLWGTQHADFYAGGRQVRADVDQKAGEDI